MATKRPSRRGARRAEPQQNASQQKNSNDNKMALQAIGVGAVLVLLLFMFFSLGSEEQPIAKKKGREGPTQIETGERMRRPTESSVVPIWLAEQFMVALGEEDEEKLVELFDWDQCFAKIDDQNNRAAGERFADMKKKEQDKLRDKLLIKIMDPDYSKIVRDFALDALAKNNFSWKNVDINPDWGNVTMEVVDERDRPKLLLLVKTQLREGFDPVNDVANKSAWGIVGVAHELKGKVTVDGRKIRSRRKDFAEDIYKKPRKKRKKSRSLGPPEADPKLVDWLSGSSESARGKIEKLCVETVQTDNFRTADQARYTLIDLGKPAIPGILRAISQFDFEEDTKDVAKTFQLIQALREITGKNFNFRPMATKQGFGMGGMTRATPQERTKAIRRWFGWWQTNKEKWTKREEIKEPETWEELGKTGEEKDKK